LSTFGEKIVTLREEKGWSRNRLHQETGLALSYLHGVETDQWLPGRENLEKIVDKLGPAATDLLDERDRIDYQRMGLDADSTLLLKDISPNMSENDRRDLLELQQRIKQRQQRRGKQ